MSKYHLKTENIYSSACVQALEDQYCSSCSAAVISPCLVSSRGFGERMISRIYNGGRQAIYTATVGAILANNMVLPVYGATIVVNSNMTSSNLSAGSGTTVQVYGITSNTSAWGGKEIIYNGGTANGTYIFVNGEQRVLSNGLANDTIIRSGWQYVSSGGIVSNTTISSGGNQRIEYTGIGINTIINSGGSQYVIQNGVTYDTTINSGGIQYLTNFGIGSGTTLNSGGALIVSNGGKAYNVIQNSGGRVYVQVETGPAYISGINEQGEDFSLSSGVASNFILYGSQYIHNNGVAIDTILNSGGYQTIGSGGMASGTTLNSDGYQYISNSGIASSTTINSATQYVGVEGIARDTVINGGYQYIVIGGVASNTIVNGGSQFISRGGVTNSTTLNSDSYQYVSSSASASDTNINDGGRQYILSSGIATGTNINSGGEQYVSHRALASDTVVNFGGHQIISSGGVASNITINSGGYQEVSLGGKAYNVVQNSGGAIGLDMWDIAGGSTYISGTNEQGESFLLSNGIASNFILNSNGYQNLHSGSAIDTTINFGGNQIVSSSAKASGTIVNSGGLQTISRGGVASNTIINPYGSQVIAFSGVANDTIIRSAGSQFVEQGAIANNTTIQSGGEQYIHYYGRANNTTIEAGGSQIIANGGIVDGAIVYNSGTQIVSSSGVLSSSIINSGGTVVVTNSGVTKDIIINNGGVQNVFSGGIASGVTTINSGGVQNVSSGGSAHNTTINSGGIQNVFSTGIWAVGETIISGGTQNIYAGIVDGTYFQAGGSQNIINGTVNQTYISNGTQTLSNGLAQNTHLYGGGIQDILGGSADFTEINASGVQNVISGIASLTSINSGGLQNVQGSANYTNIYKGGTQNILSGGIAGNTQIDGGTQNISSGGTAVDTTLANGTVNLYTGGTVSGFTATGGALNVYGDNTLQGNITLADVHVNIRHIGDMITLAMANLSANNATFNMNVDLEEQTADKLSITDSYTGNANLKLTNIASSAKETTNDGIKLVEFGSNATVNGTFGLVGGQWDEGGYVYKLEQGTQAGEGGDYYLRSTHELTDTFKTMLNIPVMNAMIAQTGMNSLQRRLGDLRAMNNPDAKQGVWVRSYYKDMTVKDLTKTDMNLFGAEAGYDWLFRADEPTKLYAGVLVGFVAANSIKTENDKGAYDKGDGEAPGVGVYATLVNENGWFVDIAARNFWSKLDMKNQASDGTELAYKPSRNVLAASVEAGKSFNKELSRNKFIRIEPKVEVGYMNAASASADVSNTDNKLKYDAANYINAKAGVLLAYNAVRSNGLLIEPLLELAYRYEFDGKGKVSYGGASAQSDLKGGTAEINAGLNMQLTDNLYWYGLGSYEASEKVKGWGVHAGIRYAFGGKKASKSKQVKHVAKPSIKKINTIPIQTPIVQQSTNNHREQTNDYSLMEEIERGWREGK